jgi:hypothetical protein
MESILPELITKPEEKAKPDTCDLKLPVEGLLDFRFERTSKMETPSPANCRTTESTIG